MDVALVLAMSEPQRLRYRLRVALDVAVDGRKTDIGRHERRARMEREREAAIRLLGCAGELADQLPRDPFRREVGRDLVQAICVGVYPGVEQISRLAQLDTLLLAPLDPRQIPQPLDHIVGVAEADLGSLRQLVEP